MKGMGQAVMGTGIGEGENRAVEAAQRAVSNPLLEDSSIEGARGIIVNITGGAGPVAGRGRRGHRPHHQGGGPRGQRHLRHRDRRVDGRRRQGHRHRHGLQPRLAQGCPDARGSRQLRTAHGRHAAAVPAAGDRTGFYRKTPNPKAAAGGSASTSTCRRSYASREGHRTKGLPASASGLGFRLMAAAAPPGRSRGASLCGANERSTRRCRDVSPHWRCGAAAWLLPSAVALGLWAGGRWQQRRRARSEPTAAFAMRLASLSHGCGPWLLADGIGGASRWVIGKRPQRRDEQTRAATGIASLSRSATTPPASCRCRWTSSRARYSRWQSARRPRNLADMETAAHGGRHSFLQPGVMSKRLQDPYATYREAEVWLQPVRTGGSFRVALVYPNLYYVGMSNLGFQGVYRLLNGFDDVSCERAFLPDDIQKAELERTGRPLAELRDRDTSARLRRRRILGEL